MRLRLINWNVSYQHAPEPKAALLERTIEEYDGDVAVVLLEEVKPRPRDAFEKIFGGGGVTAYSLDLRGPDEFDGGNRKLGVFMGVTAGQLEDVRLVERVPYPDRTLAAVLQLGEAGVNLLGAHGLTGVGYGRTKGDQLRALCRHLSRLPDSVPSIFGIDANEPIVDAWDPSDSAFAPKRGRGAALLLGADAAHGHRDVLREYLDRHPEQAARMREERPDGPLVPSYYTSKKACRYDHCLVNGALEVESVRYLYEEAVGAGSDHAMVVADLAVDGAVRG